MKTRIIDTLQHWAPEAVKHIPGTENSEAGLTDYQLLHELADLCVKRISEGSATDTEDTIQILNVVNLLYQGGNLYTRNAVENEFLTVFASEESPGSLKNHLNLFPVELRKGYIKTILEN